ncbi:MAG: phosphoribosylformylglycinamidine synthase subunit PurQ, partial [Oscillospiraceae bacterium]|nr:phosphoribosylformylglycinamidine synthase subunit PurQ [Oscillospiraceae bacterium]
AETPLEVLRRAYEYPLAQVYPQTSTGATVAEPPDEQAFAESFSPKSLTQSSKGAAFLNHAQNSASLRLPSVHSRVSKSESKPLVVLPVFPGTNCEWEMEKAFRIAGAKTRLVVFRNRTGEDIANSLKELASAFETAQIIAFSGGTDAGDEPDGSGKFIATMFRNPILSEAVDELLNNRDGLILGICNGFQALVKLGLVPYGRIIDCTQDSPTLTYNTTGRHQSLMVRTRVASVKSPWLALCSAGEVYVAPFSNGEGRFYADEAVMQGLIANGQIAAQYVDLNNEPSMETKFNPAGSLYAVESVCSPDGRIIGKMAHTERVCADLAKNIPGNKEMPLFKAGVMYFK